MDLPDIFGFKRRAEERRRREEQENRLRRAHLLNSPAPASARPSWDDSPMNPASSSGMILSPLSPISPSYGGTDHSSSSHCSGSSSYSDSGSCSSSSSDGGSSGGGD
ncbi:hypothetical protein GCM10008965_33810 [Methylorubrum aminovorans]|nr:hypothetical protein GCM10025880_27480 [Methylorubrum aminovorans]